jgi:hypothetical protein
MRQQNLRRAGKIIHLLARGLEERDSEDIFSRHINVQCIVFCVTLLLFVIFCCVSGPFFMIPP